MKESKQMTVGELAKRMDVTVRTLQYYDKEGILKPSARSEGGRRLYNNKDAVKLHQILSMKFLGFSLEDIKNQLLSLDSPAEVQSILNKQAQAIRMKIKNLEEALEAIDTLQMEVQQMQRVDWEKYADIIFLIREKNEYYWILKYFDDKTLNRIKNNFDEQAASKFIIKWQNLCDHIILLIKQNELPDSDKGQRAAKDWWDMVTDFTGGDMEILQNLMKFNENKESWDNEDFKERQKIIDQFIGEALQIYFSNQNIELP